MWVHPYTWLQLLSEIQRRSYESRVSQTDPVSGLPQSNIKKSLLNCFNFIKSHFIRISNIPWDHGGIKLYLSDNIDSGIVQCTAYCNMRGNKSAPYIFLIRRQQIKTALGTFGYCKTNHTPSFRIHFLKKLVWPERLLFFFNIILLKSFILIVLISNNIFCFPILWTLCKVKGQWSKMDFVKATKPLQKKIHCIMDALFPIGTEKYPGFSLIFLFCLFDIWCLPEGFVKKPKAFRLQFNGI